MNGKILQIKKKQNYLFFITFKAERYDVKEVLLLLMSLGYGDYGSRLTAAKYVSQYMNQINFHC